MLSSLSAVSTCHRHGFRGYRHGFRGYRHGFRGYCHGFRGLLDLGCYNINTSDRAEGSCGAFCSLLQTVTSPRATTDTLTVHTAPPKTSVISPWWLAAVKLISPASYMLVAGTLTKLKYQYYIIFPQRLFLSFQLVFIIMTSVQV